MSEQTGTGENPAKMKNIIGFVLALVSMFLGTWLIGVLFAASLSVGVAALGLILPIAAIVISVMGMKGSKAAGHKAGLAVAGLVIAIVALLWLGLVVGGLGALSSMASDIDLNEINNSMNELNNH